MDAKPRRAERGWKWNRGAISDGHMSPGRAYSRRQSRGNAIRSLPACLPRMSLYHSKIPPCLSRSSHSHWRCFVSLSHYRALGPVLEKHILRRSILGTYVERAESAMNTKKSWKIKNRSHEHFRLAAIIKYIKEINNCVLNIDRLNISAVVYFTLKQDATEISSCYY